MSGQTKQALNSHYSFLYKNLIIHTLKIRYQIRHFGVIL